MSERADDFIRDLQAEIHSAASCIGLQQDAAERLSLLAACAIMEKRGGARIWIRKLDRETRDKMIRAEFNGRNHEALCRRYRISRRRLYQIAKNI
jgi:Mor family transcriptional regulator